MSTHTRRLAETHDPEEIIAQHPDQVRAAIERAEANDRDAFAAALRAAYEHATEGSGDGE